jgi:hypothetical protein
MSIMLMVEIHVTSLLSYCSDNSRAMSKGAPGSKSQTGTQLVSPASAPEKKNWTPPEFDLKTTFYGISNALWHVLTYSNNLDTIL